MPYTFRLFSIFFFALIFLSNCSGIRESTKKHSPEKIASIEKGDQKITITYSSPYKKGRLIFGKKTDDALVPYGKKWRTGANEATEITLAQPVKIEGKTLSAGKYSLYTIPNEKSWIIAFNSKTDYWGATLGSPFKENKDVLRVEVPTNMTNEVEEQLAISLEDQGQNIVLIIHWDQVKISLTME